MIMPFLTIVLLLVFAASAPAGEIYGRVTGDALESKTKDGRIVRVQLPKDREDIKEITQNLKDKFGLSQAHERQLAALRNVAVRLTCGNRPPYTTNFRLPSFYRLIVPEEGITCRLTVAYEAVETEPLEVLVTSKSERYDIQVRRTDNTYYLERQ